MSDREVEPQMTAGAIDLSAEAMVFYTSELPEHPVEYAFDGDGGPGGTRWVAEEADQPQVVEIELDHPTPLSRLVLEAEETKVQRTQEVRVEVSSDHGETYRHVLTQEYNFSPQGGTFQREDWRLDQAKVTNLRLTVVPDKQGSGRATLTSIICYAT